MSVKLAIIRGKELNGGCPYALDIPAACSCVGGAIDLMTPTEGLKDDGKQAANNKVIYHTQKNGEQCKYANEILDKFGKVDCSYGDNAAGEGRTGYLPGSPLYPSIFITNTNPSPQRGQDITDVRALPDSSDRGYDVNFGLFSTFANRSNEMNLLKIAETTNNTIHIKEKWDKLRKEYYATLANLFSTNHIKKLGNTELTELLAIINDWAK